jgi:2,3-bisphosphoglycerate-dependent phosphoglycerate mutase
MLENIPPSESLKDTLGRSRVYWDETIAPKLQEGRTLLVVGHENNLRSLIMQLEDISPEDIINLSLPRAVPLAYRLDANLKPLDRPDGKLDEATGFLRGEWLGGDNAVSEILDRDHKQVYDTTIEQNLELDESRKKWSDWMNFVIGKPSPEARAKAEEKVAA